MSYILDALRKADAERARGAVPDLHAQPVLRSSAGAAPSVGAPPWAWAAAAATVVALGAIAWALLAREPAAGATNVAAPTPPSTSPTTAAPQAPPAPIAAAPARAPAPALALARPAPRKPAANSDGIAAGTPVAAPARLSAPAAAPAAGEPRLYAQAELPDEIRRALPALAIGGAMYSQNAASRMLIINGQVFHERDKLAPDLTLVQIKLKTAVLEYRGYRYSVSY